MILKPGPMMTSLKVIKECQVVLGLSLITSKQDQVLIRDVRWFPR